MGAASTACVASPASREFSAGGGAAPEMPSPTVTPNFGGPTRTHRKASDAGLGRDESQGRGFALGARISGSDEAGRRVGNGDDVTVGVAFKASRHHQGYRGSGADTAPQDLGAPRARGRRLANALAEGGGPGRPLRAWGKRRLRETGKHRIRGQGIYRHFLPVK